MSHQIKLHISSFCLLCSIAFFSSCEDFLDREPESQVTPEAYFTNASELKANLDGMYSDILPSHGNNSYGLFGDDADTDNQVSRTAGSRYATGEWRVPNSEDSDWKFDYIYKVNFFLSNVLPKYGEAEDGSANTISGELSDIKHYLGEAYFLRACEYFKRYVKFGDFPIVTEPLADDKGALTEASKRSPRNEVARFILNDLDKAIRLLQGNDKITTRVNADAARLLKSRVALFEGTWLKYFKGTAFVPNGEGWPGKNKDYNANYEYPGGNIDSEINYFLDEAMSASKEVAEKYKGSLAENTGYLQQSIDEPANPYYDMFAQEDLSSVSEVLLWRQYARGLVTHNVNVAANQGNYQIGVTKGFVNNFLMADGTPVYAHGTYADGDGYYAGDKTIADVRTNRDSRLVLFLKEPGQVSILYPDAVGTEAWMTEPYPQITLNDVQRGYCTGYALRKGGSFDQKYYQNSSGYTGCVIYRATEALLNYMEASYERNGKLDASAREYWTLIRQRAHVNTDFEATVAATDISKEAENDWGAYSAGQLLTDKTLYNIRRERRCEMVAEGLRYMDLCRWRAMDQMVNTPYIVEGFHLWNTPMENWYTDLVSDGSDKANVSPKSVSEYLRPYQRNETQICHDGFVWHMAHYLSPVMIKQFLLTSPDGASIEQSVIYQNPYWPTAAGQSAEK